MATRLECRTQPPDFGTSLSGLRILNTQALCSSMNKRQESYVHQCKDDDDYEKKDKVRSYCFMELTRSVIMGRSVGSSVPEGNATV